MEDPNRGPRRDLRKHKFKLDAAAETRAVAEAMQCLDDMLQEKEDIRKQSLREYWINYRKLITHREDIDYYHACTWECRQKDQIRCFLPSRNAYGCLASGSMHECLANTASCKAVYTTTDGQLVCIFSAMVIGVASSRSFANPKRDGGGAGYGNRGSNSFHSSDASAYRAHGVGAMPKRQWTGTTTEEVLEDPLDKVLAAKSRSNKKKRKRKRKTPILLAAERGRKVIEVARLKDSDYRRREAQQNGDVLKAEIEGILRDLVWNNTTRLWLRQEREARCTTKALRQMHKYVDECIHDEPAVRPRTCDFDRIWNTTMQQARSHGEDSKCMGSFKKRKRNLLKEAHYVHIALNMWFLAQSVDSCREHKFAVRFRPFVVGLLYAMAKGPIVMSKLAEATTAAKPLEEDSTSWDETFATVDGKPKVCTYVMLEQDEWLAIHLPLPKELCEYKSSARRRVQKKVRKTSATSSWISSGRSSSGSSQEVYSRGDITKGGNYVQIIMQDYEGKLSVTEIFHMLNPA